MAVTYGFYNSLNGDRTYNAEQMSAIFDGIITDGVFGSIGGALMTIAGEGMQVIVKTGKAWFNGTWTLNDAQMAIPVDAADVSLTRIDAVVLEVNASVSVRENSIKIVKGTPSANPTKPTMAADEDLHQYALAYITVASGVTSITAANIEVNVGKDDCPFITSVLQQTSITDLFNQWEAEFDAWFANIKAQLAGDVATNLQRQIDTKVNLSDKATEDDIASATAGKWVDAATIGGVWKIGDIKYSYAEQSSNWLQCDGSSISQDAYPELYDICSSNMGYRRTLQLIYDSSKTSRIAHSGDVLELYSNKLTLYSAKTGAVIKSVTVHTSNFGNSFKKDGKWYYVLWYKTTSSSQNGAFSIDIVDEDLNLVAYYIYTTNDTYSSGSGCVVNEYGDLALAYSVSSKSVKCMVGAKVISFGDTSGSSLSLSQPSFFSGATYITLQMCGRILVYNVYMSSGQRDYVYDFSSSAGTYGTSKVCEYELGCFTIGTRLYSVYDDGSLKVYDCSSSSSEPSFVKTVTAFSGSVTHSAYSYDDQNIYIFAVTSTNGYIATINKDSLNTTVSEFSEIYSAGLNMTYATFGFFSNNGITIRIRSTAIYSNISDAVLPSSTIPPSFIKAK